MVVRNSGVKQQAASRIVTRCIHMLSCVSGHGHGAAQVHRQNKYFPWHVTGLVYHQNFVRMLSVD